MCLFRGWRARLLLSVALASEYTSGRSESTLVAGVQGMFKAEREMEVAEGGVEAALKAAKNGTVFRGEGRAPAEIFEDGMTARDPSMSLREHLGGGNGLISTSRSKAVAHGFALQRRGWIYEIDNIGGTRVKYSWRDWELMGEREVTFTRIEPSQIR